MFVKKQKKVREHFEGAYIQSNPVAPVIIKQFQQLIINIAIIS